MPFKLNSKGDFSFEDLNWYNLNLKIIIIIAINQWTFRLPQKKNAAPTIIFMIRQVSLIFIYSSNLIISNSKEK
jgi:hypothetical protein